MRNCKKWRQARERRSAAARKAAEARWAAVRSRFHGEPVRTTRVVEIVIRDSHRQMRTIRMVADEQPRGWGRWAVTENWQVVGERRLGRTAIAGLIARSLA